MENRKTAADLFKALQKNIKNVVDFTDTMSQITAHLYVMNDGLHSTEEMQNKIFYAAQRSGSGYLAMSEAVAKMGLAAPGMFHSDDEIIALNEQLNKQLAISGVTSEGAAAVISQITDAFSSGVLEENQLSYLLQQAPLVVQTIADYMNKPIEKLRELAQEGEITGGVIKEALLSASDSTNAKFEMLPRTFEQTFNGIQDKILMIFQPIIERIVAFSNSNIFKQLGENIIIRVALIVEIISTIFDGIGSIGAVINDNWTIVQPIIMGIIAAMGTYLGYLTIINGIELISNGIKTVSAVANLIYALATRTLTQEIIEEAASQTRLNAAFLSCPITWIILGIIAMIAVIYSLVALYNKWTESSVSATGIIAGVFGSLAAHVGNGLIFIWNMFVQVANFCANVFRDPVAAVKILFLDMAQSVVGYIRNIATGIENLINKIPGMKVDLTSSLEKGYQWLQSTTQDVKSRSDWIEQIESKDYIDYSSAFHKGYDVGKRLGDKISSFSLKDALGLGDNSALSDIYHSSVNQGIDTTGFLYGQGQNNDTVISNLPDNQYLGTATAETLGSIAADTSSIKDSVTVTSEEIAYLREIAEKEAVNRFTTAEIKVNMNNTNTISSNMDVDGITGRLKEGLYKAMATAREGV